MKSEDVLSSPNTFSKIVDVLLRLAILFFLMSLCIDILKPFILILTWGLIIAIALNPLHRTFVNLFNGKKILVSVLLILLVLGVIGIPSLMITDSLLDGMRHLKGMYDSGQPLFPPPGPRTETWPQVIKPLLDIWQMASENVNALVMKYPVQVKIVGKWLFKSFAGIGKGLAQLVVSLIIACVMLINYESISSMFRKIFIKLAGENGAQYNQIITTTIINVFKGVLGVAIIQAVMAATGFFLADVPFAGLWTIVCLILAIIQVGVGPIAIPIAIYMFFHSSTLTATLLAVWLAITLVADNVIKPILLGRGAPAPMLVIFLGSIGGFMSYGFLGLFLGAVILSIMYKLFLGWLNSGTDGQPTET
jgi:predicted PurR-regulated permease PerM